MRTLNYTTARKDLANTIDNVIDDSTPLIITKGSDRAVVMMSLDDWNAWQETLYLLKSPANAKQLLNAIEDFDKGKNIVFKELITE